MFESRQQGKTLIMKILALINEIRSIPDAEKYFLKGGCFKLFTILRVVFPQAEPYYNGEHVITKIFDKYYDITGMVDNRGYVHMDKSELQKAHRWHV